MKVLVFESSIDLILYIKEVLTDFYPILILYIILAIVLNIKRIPRQKILNIILLGLIGINIFIFSLDMVKYYLVKKAIETKTYKHVAGEIKKFTPMLREGHSLETFEVNNINFIIHYSRKTPIDKTLFYQVTKEYDGFIKHDGQLVTIDYISIFGDNNIIKLWIEEK